MMTCENQVEGRLPLLHRRNAMIRAVRSFFEGRGYWEVETPCLVPVPGEEVHLRCFHTELEYPDGEKVPRFLHTSPEFAMKRLVAATKHKIFQFARVWRNGEAGRNHMPEFTMLEWYRPHASLASLMDETESLLKAVLPKILPANSPSGNSLDLVKPFERLTVQEAFRQYVGADVLETAGNAPALAHQAGIGLRQGENWEDLFFRLLLERIEPYIGREQPVFLTHWPAEQAALARLCPYDSRVALRFELYAGGLELANAFEELTDPVEQRRRFEADRHRRMQLAPEQNWPLDENFLSALADLPPCSGIALGFDRLVMLATSAPDIKDVLWLWDN